jgi:hypothetical protein
MMIIFNEILGMSYEQYVWLPVIITERECSQSICLIKLLTRALRALGNPASTIVFCKKKP